MRSALSLLCAATLALTVPARAQEQSPPDTEAQIERPFVVGGIYDKPFVYAMGSGTAIGGYLDAQARYERDEGVDELNFLVAGFNFFLFSPISEHIRFAAEVEIEELGEEIALELAIVDFEIHPALILRAGVLLSPLGRFNLAHDSPAMELIDRPLVSSEILGATLSEAGVGFLGTVHPGGDSRFSYEIYAVNGFDDGIVTESEGGTRIPAGRHNIEDNNFAPSVAARIGISPFSLIEVGVSTHLGTYNTDEIDGVRVDTSRSLALLAFDTEVRWEWLTVLGEMALAWVELPPALVGLFAEQQQGAYLEVDGRFLEGVFDALPDSSFNAAAQVGFVDFDSDIDGDSQTRLALGVNFRPHPDTAFKLSYHLDWNRDRFDNLARAAGVLFGAATYF